MENSLNNKINELYKTIDAQDSMINQLIGEKRLLQERIDKAIKKVKAISFKFTSDKFWYAVVLRTTEDGEELLEILGDKENE